MASTTRKIAFRGEVSIVQHQHANVRSWRWLILAVCLCTALVIGIQAFLLTNRHALFVIPASSREARVLYTGFHAAERDQRGRYRWTTGDSAITFPQMGAGARFGFHLRLGPPPITLPNPQVRVSFNNSPAIAFATTDQARVYRLLVPRQASMGQLKVHIESDAVEVAGDPRTVGLRVESAELQPYGGGVIWPGPLLVVAELALLGLLALLLRALHMAIAPMLGAMLAATLALVGVSSIQMLLILPYLIRLLVAMGLIVALTYGLFPWLTRRLTSLCAPELTRALWGVTLLAVLIRLTGALYPIFTAHDLPLNVERLLRTVSGDLLVTNRSFEFGGGVTIYPPGPYLALQPGLLFGLPPSVLVAGGIALLDGLSAFGVGLLARTLGLGRRGVLLAALLYAGTPVTLMALFFGHTAQAFGQTMMVPLLLALLGALRRPNEVRRWLLAALPLSVALLSHIGVTVIAVAWLGLSWLALVLMRQISWQTALRFLLLVAGCSLLALALIYGTVLGSHLEQTQEIGSDALEEGFAPAYWLIWRGFVVAFNAGGLALAPVGLLLLARHSLPFGSRELIGAWIVAAACFLGVELITGLQVRYIYFLAPIVCVLLGCVLERLAAVGAYGSRIAVAVALLLVLQGSITWYNGVLFAERVSMVALLR